MSVFSSDIGHRELTFADRLRGINWGLIGIFDFNLVHAIFGATFLERLIYILVGLSAVWQLVPLSRAFATSEPIAEGGVGATPRRTV